MVERATTPRGGHGSRKEGYEKKLLVTGTVTRVIWEGVSQCGGIQIHRCPRIFLRGGGVSANYKIRIKSTFLVLYVVFRCVNNHHNYFINAKYLFSLHKGNHISNLMRHCLSLALYQSSCLAALLIRRSALQSFRLRPLMPA